MAKISAGVLMYRLKNGYPEILLFHPGGPYWAKKNLGSWSIPKGELNEKELPVEAAKRELGEEAGINVEGILRELTPLKQKTGKTIFAWALEQDFNPFDLKSNSFEIEWPPRSGQMKKFPEMDKAAWFSVQEAKKMILAGQIPFIEELEKMISSSEY